MKHNELLGYMLRARVCVVVFAPSKMVHMHPQVQLQQSIRREFGSSARASVIDELSVAPSCSEITHAALREVRLKNLRTEHFVKASWDHGCRDVRYACSAPHTLVNIPDVIVVAAMAMRNIRHIQRSFL